MDEPPEEYSESDSESDIDERSNHHHQAVKPSCLSEGAKPSGLLEGAKPMEKSSAMDPTLSTFGEKFTPSTFEAEKRVKPLTRDPMDSPVRCVHR